AVEDGVHTEWCDISDSSGGRTSQMGIIVIFMI
ncbi:MAG: hypothetical protein PWP37_1514, partial [Thermotogota bacterium]|nr:hypothetical protein [Thermotogota bacterium]